MERLKDAKVIVLILVILLGWSYFHEDTYEGYTAETWFDEYDESEAKYQEFRDCVEDFDSFGEETKAQYGGVFYYCE